MRVVVLATHHVVALRKRDEELLHAVDAGRHVLDAGLDHVRLAEVQEIDTGIHLMVLSVRRQHRT